MAVQGYPSPNDPYGSEWKAPPDPWEVARFDRVRFIDKMEAMYRREYGKPFNPTAPQNKPDESTPSASTQPNLPSSTPDFEGAREFYKTNLELLQQETLALKRKLETRLSQLHTPSAIPLWSSLKQAWRAKTIVAIESALQAVRSLEQNIHTTLVALEQANQLIPQAVKDRYSQYVDECGKLKFGSVSLISS